MSDARPGVGQTVFQIVYRPAPANATREREKRGGEWKIGNLGKRRKQRNPVEAAFPSFHGVLWPAGTDQAQVQTGSISAISLSLLSISSRMTGCQDI